MRCSIFSGYGSERLFCQVELANKLLGEDWETRFVSHARHGGIERVLL